jgi:hypothetical protein
MIHVAMLFCLVGLDEICCCLIDTCVACYRKINFYCLTLKWLYQFHPFYFMTSYMPDLELIMHMSCRRSMMLWLINTKLEEQLTLVSTSFISSRYWQKALLHDFRSECNLAVTKEHFGFPPYMWQEILGVYNYLHEPIKVHNALE